MNYFLFLGLLLFLYVTFLFGVSIIKKRNDIADIGWGLGFVFLALFSFYFNYQSYGFLIKPALITSLVLIWGLRLSTHIYLRNRSKEEDYRYKRWRQQWGEWFYIRSYGQVYLLQGFLIYIISLPILLINQSGVMTITFFDLIALLIWLVGFFFEVVGDYQLKKFIQNPKKDGILETGLWKYSRHPNYFGEVIQWWAFWILAATIGKWWTILSPITITVLILKISGIPMMEKRLAEKEGFEEYKERVSKFFPLPPKNK